MSNSRENKQFTSGTPPWALRKIREAREKKQTTLDLSSFSRDWDAQLTKFPEEILELSGLTTLNLGDNRLSAVPEAITQMSNLTRLDLQSNEIHALPDSIALLEKLTHLNLSRNRFSVFPESIYLLKNLISLDLAGNGLHILAESIGHLQKLTDLNLNNNRLRSLPASMGQLQNLTHLSLMGNQFRVLPEAIGPLKNLMSLALSNNELSTLPESIRQLENLETLLLSDNQLSTLPESMTELANLSYLNASGNQLSSLPASIHHLQNLTTLILIKNQLRALPESIVHVQALKSLLLGDNPLIIPPMEIARQGIQAIREYFRQLDQEGMDYLYEAKLLILGEGGAGKTTLANKLLRSSYTLTEEKSTAGVDVLKWFFPIEGDRKFTANLWDFGGQEIYHATHQFFLTRRSLYVLVADTRKEDTDFYYWLNIAELLSDGSPLLIVKNEKQDRHREINERALKGQFDSLKEVLATNLATNRGLQDVKQEIEHYIQKLPHIGSPLPRTWVRVREQLEKDARNYVSLEEYLAICERNGFAETKDALQLSGYLHDIGVFLHFQDDPLLKKTVILKPKWGTGAVYQVLDNKTVIKNLGRFTRSDLDMIWELPAYEAMRDELLQLMMKFKLCYEVPIQKGQYIAPQLLTENQPDYAWEEKDNLLLRYSYEFMPKGILTQFIVVMHPYIWGQDKVWKSGILIEKDGTRAEVIEYYGKREIHVRVAGAQARDLLTIIRHEFKQIHDTYKRLKYDELVRCNCSNCKESEEPHFYPISVLMKFRTDNQLKIQCQKSYIMVSVMGLLGDVVDLSRLADRDEVVQPIYVAGDYYQQGDNKMTEINQNIEGSTIHGSVVAAKSIQDSFNTIENSNVNDELKDTLTQLTQAVEAMAEKLPKEKAEEAAEDLKVLAEQATKEKSNPKWYNVSIEGLIAAAQNLGKVGDEVIQLTEKVRKILTGGLL